MPAIAKTVKNHDNGEGVIWSMRNPLAKAARTAPCMVNIQNAAINQPNADEIKPKSRVIASLWRAKPQA